MNRYYALVELKELVELMELVELVIRTKKIGDVATCRLGCLSGGKENGRAGLLGEGTLRSIK